MARIFNELCDAFPKQLADNLWLMGNYYFNLYLIKGNKESALVEVGISAIVDSVISQLEALDTYPTYLVVTHPHADHLTGLSGLKERFPDACVVAGEGALEFIEHPKAAEALISDDKFMNEAMVARGHKPGRAPLTKSPSLGNYLLVNDGDVIDLGGVALRFVTLKGHSPGNIGAYVPEISALIVSDSLGLHYPNRRFLPVFFTGFHDYIASMDRLSQANPEILCLGHQGPLIGADVKQAFHVARQTSFDFLERIVSNRENKESIADDIFHEYYIDEYTVFSPNNVKRAVRLLVRRGIETLNNEL